MKGLVLYFSLLFALLLTGTYGYGSPLIPLNDKKQHQTQITLINSLPDETIINFAIHAYCLHTVNTPIGNASIATVPQGTPVLRKGAPDIYKLTQSIIIPDDAEMSIEIISSEFTDVDNILLAPSKGTIYRNIDPSSVPFSYGKEYRNDALFPLKTVELWKPYIAGYFRGQTVVVYPLQYNPITKIFRIYTSITVRIMATGKPGKVNILKRSGKRNMIAREFSEMYRRSFLNYSASNYDQLSDQGSILIISYGDFMDEMEQKR